MELAVKQKWKLFVISHTHWDREWYRGFQTFRRRLVDMMDELIEHMENNDAYNYFHLDGQTIVLQDYLDIRPEMTDRLKKLISQGRIIIGPWYVMPDEFLVCGESLVRNLLLGFSVCRDYGVKPMNNGYVVDIFGHNSQFPQILNGFGITSAVLYRGIADYPKDAFIWKGADGSSVLALKLDRERSYSNFFFALRWPFEGREYDEEELVSRMEDLLSFSGELAISRNILMMDGVDHGEIEPRLTEILEILRKKIPSIEIEQCQLSDYIEAQMEHKSEMEILEGELYSVGERGINNQVLKNVLSAMVHLKQANDECERLLLKWAEPFDALASLSGNVKSTDYSAAPVAGNDGFLSEAWKILLENHPHDSICGCSITQVHEDNEYRFRQVKELAEGVIDRSLKTIASRIDRNGQPGDSALVLFNPEAAAQPGVVETVIEFPANSQGNIELYGPDGQSVPFQIIDVDKNIREMRHTYRKLIEFKYLDFYTIAFQANIPATGYTAFSYKDVRNAPLDHGDFSVRGYHPRKRHAGTMQKTHRVWENEYLEVEIRDNGCLSVTSKETGKVYRDLLIFEDRADTGDGYHWKSPPADSAHYSYSCPADVSVESDGPFITLWKIVHYMKLPVRMDADGQRRSMQTAELQITTSVRLKKGSRIIEFSTVVNNTLNEHRLRVLFPTFIETDHCMASTPFYLQKRPVQKPVRDTSIEVETNVYPNQGVILLRDDQDGIGLFNKGLYEFEVTEEQSRTLALTLFRSFGRQTSKKRSEMSFMKREMTFSYALGFFPGETTPAQMAAAGENWRTGIRSICAGEKTKARLPRTVSHLEIDTPEIRVSSFYRRDACFILRIYNPAGQPQKGTAHLGFSLKSVVFEDLKGKEISRRNFEGSDLPIELKAGEIQTIRMNLKS